MLAAQWGYIEIVCLLLNHHIDAKTKDHYGSTALIYAGHTSPSRCSEVLNKAAKE